ncbi:50S ribosomal protein L25/general stress protein Ctc [Luminiphilus sp.]|nr:50S ribosomal protein L25/general stress protein Ctc [Luminiphilus sp.]MDB4048728.1 50S ribosomal protein L25/general stress protein Ctc [Luminiphilus sp.]
MSEAFIVVAETRVDEGKGASRRLRRLEGKMPAVIYGGDQDAQSLTLIRKDFEYMLENEACFSSILEVQVGGKSQNAIIKDIQRHPAKGFPMHADFLRVRMDQAIKVNVPLHFINEEQCTGVKLGGGMIQKQATDIEIQCLPKDLPEYLEVDMLDVELGQIVHLSDITLPEGAIATALELGDDHDLAIASVIAPRGIKGDDEDETSEDVDGASESGDEDAAAGDAGEGNED